MPLSLEVFTHHDTGTEVELWSGDRMWGTVAVVEGSVAVIVHPDPSGEPWTLPADELLQLLPRAVETARRVHDASPPAELPEE